MNKMVDYDYDCEHEGEGESFIKLFGSGVTNRAVNLVNQLVGLVGFIDIIIDANFHQGFSHDLFIVHACEHDDRDVPGFGVFLEPPGDIQAVHARHVIIENNDTRDDLICLSQAFLAAGGCEDRVTTAFQDMPNEVQYLGIIVNREDRRALAVTPISGVSVPGTPDDGYFSSRFFCRACLLLFFAVCFSLRRDFPVKAGSGCRAEFSVDMDSADCSTRLLMSVTSVCRPACRSWSELTNFSS
jgi:hypothetical protein